MVRAVAIPVSAKARHLRITASRSQPVRLRLPSRMGARRRRMLLARTAVPFSNGAGRTLKNRFATDGHAPVPRYLHDSRL